MYFTRGLIIVGLILTSSSVLAVDYTITVPETEKARVEAAVQRGYGTSVPQVLANMLFRIVSNVEINDAEMSAKQSAKESKEAEIKSKLIITAK